MKNLKVDLDCRGVRKKSKEVLLPLLGGLGNQLFQLSAALYSNPGRDIRLVSDLGHQRRNENGKPDIESFTLPKNVFPSNNRASHNICTKAFNLLLRSSIQEKRNLLTITTTHVLSKIILCTHSRKILKFHISRGVGFSEWNPNESRLLAIGYFQSYIWTSAERVRRELSNLRITNPSVEFLDLEKHFASNYIIAIHVRLTDYLKENSIGALDSVYFDKVLKNISNLDGREVWLFSDDPQAALEMMPHEIQRNCKTFAKSGISANEEWQLMRHATEFYISNSTYSWWAARLAFNPNAKVFVPKPWFASGPQPNKLTPPEWIEVERFK
jgi:hypothetical protein